MVLALVALGGWIFGSQLSGEFSNVMTQVQAGLGQLQTGRPYRGYVFMGAAALSLGSTLWLAVRANQANNIYESAPLTVRMQAYDQARSYASSRNAMIATTAIVWAVNAAECWFLYGTRDR